MDAEVQLYLRHVLLVSLCSPLQLAVSDRYDWLSTFGESNNFLYLSITKAVVHECSMLPISAREHAKRQYYLAVMAITPSFARFLVA